MLAEEILIPKHTSVVQGNGSKHLMFFFFVFKIYFFRFFYCPGSLLVPTGFL